MSTTTNNDISFSLAFNAGRGEIERVRKCLMEGADIRWDNDRALRNAARNGDPAMIKFLCSRGANLGAALDRVTYSGDVKATAHLLDYASATTRAYTLRAAFGHLAMLEAGNIPLEQAPNPTPERIPLGWERGKHKPLVKKANWSP